MKSKSNEPGFTIRFRALPDRVPVEIRLRRLLKACLRAYGFRALIVEEAKTPSTEGKEPNE